MKQSQINKFLNIYYIMDSPTPASMKDTISNLVSSADALNTTYETLGLGDISVIYNLVNQLEGKLTNITSELQTTKDTLETTNSQLSEKNSENDSLKSEITNITKVVGQLNKMKEDMEKIQSNGHLKNIKEKLNKMIGAEGSGDPGTTMDPLEQARTARRELDASMQGQMGGRYRNKTRKQKHKRKHKSKHTRKIKLVRRKNRKH